MSVHEKSALRRKKRALFWAAIPSQEQCSEGRMEKIVLRGTISFTLLDEYYYNCQIQEDEIGGVCRAQRESRNSCPAFVGKLEDRRTVRSVQ